MIHESRVYQRIVSAQEAMSDYKAKVYRLRRIVAGDADALTSRSVGINQDNGNRASRPFNATNPAILMQEFDEGRNNDLLLLLGVLVEQTCYYFPNIEVRNLSPHQQVVQSQYLKKRLTECNAIHHNKIALWDHLMGGMGDIYITMNNGKPSVRWADALDVKFDQQARLVCDVRWKSLTVVEPLWYWIEMFGRDAFLAPLDQPVRTTKGQFGKKDLNMDLPFELEFYYDIEGEKGTQMVFIKTGDDTWAKDPVYKGDNPNYFTNQGQREPYLPFESIFYTMLPSVRLPVGAAEKALPAQIAVWRAAKRIQKIIDKGPAFYEIMAGMSVEEKQKFMAQMLDGLVESDDNRFGRIKEHPPLPITPTDVEELNRNQQALKTQLGASSYALGQPEQGVKYAREVNAIQAEGSLTSGSIAKDNSDFWSRWIPKFVAKGQLWDKKPFTARVDGIDYPFNESDPIRDYLVPDAEMVISEDSMRFIPAPIKVQQASMVLDKAIQLAPQFPGAVAPAYRKYLEANGVENIDERMKPPAPVAPPMPGAPGAMPGAIPGQEAALSPQLSAEVGTA